MLVTMRWLACCVALCGSALAHAGEHDAAFAQHHGVKPTEVREVAGYELPAGGDFTHVLIGRYDHAPYVMTGAVLLRCDPTECQGRRADFGAADTIDVLGVIDLEGAPRPFPSRALGRGARYTKLPGKAPKWPALVVRTTERKAATSTTRSGKLVTGNEARARLYVISLAAIDRASVILQDTLDERYPSGAGTTTTYRLERGESKTGLEIIATEQRHLDRDSRCLRPEPIELRFTLDGRHYRAVAPPERTGCR